MLLEHLSLDCDQVHDWEDARLLEVPLLDGFEVGKETLDMRRGVDARRKVGPWTEVRRDVAQFPYDPVQTGIRLHTYRGCNLSIF